MVLSVSRLKALFIPVILLAIFASSATRAATFESVTPPNVRVFPLFDARLDFSLRIEAINRAKSSIDVVVYMNVGEIGEQMTKALQAAIRRGVQVRFLTETFTTLAADRPFGSNLPSHLARTYSTNAACPSEILCMSPVRKRLKGNIDFFDGFHEKILLIDRDTEYEMAWVGGRNNDEYALGDFDFAVVMKRENRNVASACSAIGKAFDSIWETANRIQKPERTSPLPYPLENSKKLKPNPRPNPARLVSQSKLTDEAEYQAMRRALFLNSPIMKSEEVPNFSPTKITYSSNSFFDQILDHPEMGKGMEDRAALMSDDLRLIEKEIGLSREITLTAMAFDLPTTLMAALKDAVKRGARLRFFTNSPDLEKARIPLAVRFDESMKDLKELYDLAEASGSRAKIEVFMLDPKKIAESEDYAGWLTYLHRKTIVTDRSVFVGSDNFTEASRVKNNEFLAQFEDRNFAGFMRKRIGKETELFRALPCSEIFFHADRANEWGRGILAKFYRQFL